MRKHGKRILFFLLAAFFAVNIWVFMLGQNEAALRSKIRLRSSSFPTCTKSLSEKITPACLRRYGACSPT